MGGPVYTGMTGPLCSGTGGPVCSGIGGRITPEYADRAFSSCFLFTASKNTPLNPPLPGGRLTAAPLAPCQSTKNGPAEQLSYFFSSSSFALISSI